MPDDVPQERRRSRLACEVNRGVLLLRRTYENEAEFLSLWDDLVAVKRFVGRSLPVELVRLTIPVR